ncbi:helix-turn-helix transcriptional regulator [Brucella anthropi]|uniref:helix-turn-helix transcriptional regulator n=2 Tax=Brucella anthropi TaxID=529 RepID=UPI0034E3861F
MFTNQFSPIGHKVSKIQSTVRPAKQVKSMTTSDYFTMRQVFTRYGISESTLRRWLKDQALGFPRPLPARGRRYFLKSEVIAWEQAQRQADRC